MIVEDIIYLRPTGINTYIECGAKFYFQEVEKLEVPNKVHLAFGTSIHLTLQKNFAYKIETKKDLEIEEAKQMFSEIFEREFENVDKIDLTEEKPELIKNQGIKLIEKYQNEVSPRIIPAAVEQKIKVKFKNYDYGLIGTIDLYDIDNQIIDHKTTSKEINGTIPIGYQRQISAYAILEEAAGHKVDGARIDFLKRDTTEIRHIAVVVDKEHFLKMFQITGDAIKKGIFIPNRNSYLCNKRFCKFYAECEKKFGGIVKD